MWRCLELFDALRLPVGALINTALYDYCPEVVEAHVKRGDELIGHGHTNSERQGELGEADERRLLEYCRERIRKESKAVPRGLAQPVDLRERAHAGPAAETGYRYTLNWCHDDQPVEFDAQRHALVGALPAGAERHPDDRRAADGRRATSPT